MISDWCLYWQSLEGAVSVSVWDMSATTMSNQKKSNQDYIWKYKAQIVTGIHAGWRRCLVTKSSNKPWKACQKAFSSLICFLLLPQDTADVLTGSVVCGQWSDKVDLWWGRMAVQKWTSPSLFGVLEGSKGPGKLHWLHENLSKKLKLGHCWIF